jgi:hypothetical protein
MRSNREYVCKYCGTVSKRIDTHRNWHDENCQAGPTPRAKPKKRYKSKPYVPRPRYPSIPDAVTVKYKDYVELLREQKASG